MTKIITIDGPAASGKGTLARQLAEHLGYFYLDTGKIYRLVGMMAFNHGLVPEDNPDAVAVLARNLADDFDLSLLDNPDLKSDQAGQMASRSSQFPQVRAAVLDLQRRLANHPPYGAGAVMDGRDCGTVICPNAPHKFFITASTDIRARRRFNELKGHGHDIAYEDVLTDMRLRDERDSTRSTAPMKPADDAVIIDTSSLSVDEALREILSHIKKNLDKI